MSSIPIIHQKKLRSFSEAIIEWGKDNFAPYPWRKTKNKWHALTAEIMLQRTNADQVVIVYEKFCKKYKSPGDLLKKPGVKLFKNLGLHWRNKQIKKLAKTFLEKSIPDSKADLLKLPCIGEYIASAYRSLHLGEREYIIDSNVVRIFGRYFGFKTDGETRRKNWFRELSDRTTPLNEFKQFNYGLIDFTRKICRIKPLCNECILRRKCDYFKVITQKNEEERNKKDK